MDHHLPDSGWLAWWLTAWLRGRESPDALLAAVLGADAAHDVTGLADAAESLPLVLALGPIRALGATAAGLALPVEGDPVGLGGPAPFNREALEHREAVVLVGADRGLVPVRAGRGVVWRCVPAHRRQVPDVGEADRGLRAALLETAAALSELDVARWRPELADELLNLRHVGRDAAPAGTPPICVDLAARGMSGAPHRRTGARGRRRRAHGVRDRTAPERVAAARPGRAAGRCGGLLARGVAGLTSIRAWVKTAMFFRARPEITFHCPPITSWSAATSIVCTPMNLSKTGRKLGSTTPVAGLRTEA